MNKLKDGTQWNEWSNEGNKKLNEMNWWNEWKKLINEIN